MVPILIEVDHREGSCGILEKLSSHVELEVKRVSLPVGDYLINKVVGVERKSSEDFITSIVDSRLFSQAHRLKTSFERSILLVEGKNVFDSPRMHPNAIKGAVAYLAISLQLPVIFTKDAMESAYFILLCAKQELKERTFFIKRPGYKPKKCERQKLFILQGIPGVKARISKRLLSHFDSLEKIFTASEDELRKVPGIGRFKAKQIRRIVQ